MGLDTSLVKFRKDNFEKVVKQGLSGRYVDYFDGNTISEEVAYYRKHYEVQDILMAAGGALGQCIYAELTHRTLDKIRRLAFKKLNENPDEIESFISDLKKIMLSTDFENEVIAHIWIS